MRTYEEITADLKAAESRLKDVQQNGDKAISQEDLALGYDADFYLYRCPILQHHVECFQRELRNYTMLNNQLSLF